MKTKTHTQCRLERGTERQVSYIPSDIAIQGRTVRLKESDGTWDEGWIVATVSPVAVASAYVAERSQDYKRTRAASDI